MMATPSRRGVLSSQGLHLPLSGFSPSLSLPPSCDVENELSHIYILRMRVSVVTMCSESAMMIFGLC